MAVPFVPWRTRRLVFCVYDVCGVRCVVYSPLPLGFLRAILGSSGAPLCPLDGARLGPLMWVLALIFGALSAPPPMPIVGSLFSEPRPDRFSGPQARFSSESPPGGTEMAPTLGPRFGAGKQRPTTAFTDVL